MASAIDYLHMQLTLFDTRLQRTRQLNAALDRLADRAGARIVTPARYRVASAEC